MDRIIVALIGIPLGFLIMIYRAQIKSVSGDIGFAERYLGSGGTYTFYILVGLGVCIVSAMYSLGTIQSFFANTFGMFFR